MSSHPSSYHRLREIILSTSEEEAYQRVKEYIQEIGSQY